MKNEQNKQSWLQEFREFLDIDAANVEVPATISQAVHSRLFPNPITVFTKIVFIHIIVGFLSLGFCHQFGLNPFNTQTSLADWFMNVGGHGFCMLACGVVFMMTTYLLANLFLNLEELEAIRRHKWLEIGTLSLVSLALFYFFGAQLVFMFAFLWVLGALIGGWLSLEGSYIFRRALTNGIT